MSQIGRYEVKRRTGSHGTAALYEAFDPVMKRPVTIRIAEGESDAAAGEEQPFDPHQMAGLDHPNIIRVLACEEEGARPYVVMEQFEGRSLSAVLSEQPSLDQARVSEILKSAASALDHVHAKGLIHNHLTPDRIMLGEDGLMKIAGFEVACTPEQAYAEYSEQQYPASAIPYMPPEYLRGDKLDKRSDQFSLAAIAFHALTGTRPFQAGSAVALLRQVMFEKPALGKLRDHYPLAAVKVFETALSATPSARFGSCSEFASALDTAMTVQEAASATRLVEMPASPQEEALRVPAGATPGRGSSRWLVWIVGLVLLAGLAALAVKLFSPAPVVVTPTPTPPPKNTVVPEPTPAPAPPAPAPPKAVQETKQGKPKVPKDKVQGKSVDKSPKASTVSEPATTPAPQPPAPATKAVEQPQPPPQQTPQPQPDKIQLIPPRPRN